MIATAKQLHRRSRVQRPGVSGFFDELIVDNFAGGGGASIGIERALGRAVDIAINHDPASVEMHSANHPHTRHLCESVWEVDPVDVTAGRPVGLAWFSPDCTHFSRAKGAVPVSKKIRGLAWVVIKWVKRLRKATGQGPRVIILENVREFETWGPLNDDGRPCPIRKGQTFKRWLACLRREGYTVEMKVLDAADFGAPTHRRRLFLVARRDGEPIVWPTPTHGDPKKCAAQGRKAWRTAAEVIDWRLTCHSIFLTKEEAKKVGVKRPLADKTMQRIARGIQRYVIDNPKPFIIPACGGFDAPFVAGVGGRAGQSHETGMDQPVGTVTAKNDRALICPTLVGTGGSAYAGKPRPADGPMGTVLPNSRQAVAAAFLSHFNQGGKQESGADEPMRTVTSGGLHAAEVRAFLIKYYGQGIGQEATEPLHTVVSVDRFGLVQVHGEPYRIVDIGLRMLTPRELANAQGFPATYILTGTARNQVARIGNSVSPPVAEALARANMGARRAAATTPAERAP